ANRLFTIALASVCGAAIMSVGGVFAAEGNQTYYPQDFERTLTLESLRDYAISGDTYAFAYGTSIRILSTDESGERQLKDYPHTSEVIELDYNEKGDLYFKDIMNVTYLYSSPKPTATEEEYVFQLTDITDIKIDNILYTLDKPDGLLTCRNNGTPTEIGSGFSKLKEYGGAIYAVKDNVPHKITESTSEALDLSYTDFNGAKNIYSGDTKAKLESVSGMVETAQILKDRYYTQINAEEIGEKFTPIRTQKTTGNTPCLILCESGNASIVSIGGECFVTATDNLTERAYCQSNTDGKTYYAIEDVGVYTTPFMSGSTRITTLKSGATHEVTVLEKFVHTVLSTEFCKISFKEDGETVIGYVAANFLTPYKFSAEDFQPTHGGDKDFDYRTNVVSVVLAVLIVGLVLIAVLYVTIIGKKRDKNSKGKRKKHRQPDPDDYDD
ncbi:MAG: hypothetical protein K2I17_04415, partial [Clostridia bacterium]|nr:hypothetical protein [Clostridia bacterium]